MQRILCGSYLSHIGNLLPIVTILHDRMQIKMCVKKELDMLAAGLRKTTSSTSVCAYFFESYELMMQMRLDSKRRPRPRGLDWMLKGQANAIDYIIERGRVTTKIGELRT